MKENWPGGTVVGTFSGPARTYTLVSGDNAFRIDGDTLLTATSLDNEIRDVHTVGVCADGTDCCEIFGITVLNTDDAPGGIQISWSCWIYENEPEGMLVGTLSVLPADADDSHTYTPASGSDNLAVDGNLLVTRTELDFEAAPYPIRVCADDTGNGHICQNFSVEDVIDMNDPPSDIILSHADVAENMPPGTEVGTLTSEEQDYYDIGEHEYELVSCADGTDADNPLFAIMDDRLVTREVLDFEAGSAHDICVCAADWRESFDKRFVIHVVNLPDSLADVIRMLRTLSGTNAGVDGNVNGDGRIGLGEVIHILRGISAGEEG